MLCFRRGPESQQGRNLTHDDRVSTAIDHHMPDSMSITVLSMLA